MGKHIFVKTKGQYMENITRWREDMNIRVVKTVFYEQLILPRPCNVLFITWSEFGTSQKLKRRQIRLGSSCGKTHAFSMCYIFFHIFIKQL